MDKSYRVVLPVALLQQVSWISGEDPILAWLLVGNSGRCKLLSAAEVESDGSARSLRARIRDELHTRSESILEFHDEESLALSLRLVQVRIAPPEPGRRITLPKLLVSLMQLRPGESEVALWFVHEHVELWTIEALRSAIARPLMAI